MWLRTHVIKSFCDSPLPLHPHFPSVISDFTPPTTKLPWCQMHGYFPVLLDSGKGRSRDISKHRWVLRIILWICTQITINFIYLKDCMQFSNEQFGKKKKSRNSPLQISYFYMSVPSHWFGITNSADPTPEQTSERENMELHREGAP